MGRDEILATLERNRDAIRHHGVKTLGLFGSLARGEDSPESDMDFVVEFQEKSFDAYMELKAFLEELFGRSVDLVIADAIKPRIRDSILGEAVHASGP